MHLTCVALENSGNKRPVCLFVCHRGLDTVCSTFMYSTWNNTVSSVSCLLFIVTLVLELYVALTQSCVVHLDHYLTVCCHCTVS